MGKIFRFGQFEADRERHQLSRSGRRIKLERIPLELLFLLLEEQGRLVTREQIVARLWGNNLVLDAERSINTAIRKLRKAIADDARHPEFIETLVGKGYRFLGSYALPERNESFLADSLQPWMIAAPIDPISEPKEIRLADFRIESSDSAVVLSCNIVRAGQAIGRLPFVRLELPNGMSLPLQPEDKLLMKLLGVKVKLTADATRALQAFCIGFLQNLSTTQLARSAGAADVPELRPVGGKRLGTWAEATPPK